MVLIKTTGQVGARTCGVPHDTDPKSTLWPTEPSARSISDTKSHENSINYLNTSLDSVTVSHLQSQLHVCRYGHRRFLYDMVQCTILVYGTLPAESILLPADPGFVGNWLQVCVIDTELVLPDHWLILPLLYGYLDNNRTLFAFNLSADLFV